MVPDSWITEGSESPGVLCSFDIQIDQEKNAYDGPADQNSGKDLLHTHTVIGLQMTPVGSFFTLIPCIFSQKRLQQLKENDNNWICRM